MGKKWWISITVILLLVCLVLSLFCFNLYSKVIECENKEGITLVTDVVTDEIRQEIEGLYNNSKPINSES